MKLVCISDLHGQIKNIDIPDGDVLIIAGDICKGSTIAELKSLNIYLGSLPHRHKILIAGNHDFGMEKLGKWAVAKLFTHAHYLEDAGITIDGVHFWGSPWQPVFFDWAFNLPRGEPLAEKWARIPDHTDVLITHGPPYTILDTTRQGQPVGCADLLAAVQRIKPRLHVFGHIHESYGQQEIDGIRFVNASILDVGYKAVNLPVIIEL